MNEVLNNLYLPFVLPPLFINGAQALQRTITPNTANQTVHKTELSLDEHTYHFLMTLAGTSFRQRLLCIICLSETLVQMQIHTNRDSGIQKLPSVKCLESTTYLPLFVFHAQIYRLQNVGFLDIWKLG